MRLKVERTERERRFRYALAVAVAVVTFLVYLTALRNDFINWDDGPYVFENPHIRSLNAAFFKWAFFDFYEANWHPLTWLSHALDYALWGLNPLGHHLTSIVLHAINSFIVVLLVIRLLEAWKERAVRNGTPPFLNERAILIAAGTTGLLFGLHPVHVESVAWVAERKDLLCALFFLLSLIAYTNYARKTGDETLSKNTRSPFFNSRYLATLGLFILALLSKPMAVSLPVVLLVLDRFPFNRIRSGRTLWAACVEKLPFFALSLASSIVTILAQRKGGAMTLTEVVPLSTRLLVAAKSIIAYLWKMLLPLDLVPFYPYPKSASPLSLEYLFPLALVVAVTTACIMTAKKRGLLLSAWSYYVATLIPVLGIVQVGGQEMADRYMYLPSLGPFLVLGIGVAWAWGRCRALTRWGLFVKRTGWVMAALAIGFLSSATVKQIGIWKNGFILWNYEIEKKPGVPRAYNNRGLVYDKKGRFDEAIDDFGTAIALDSSYAAAYNNRGMVFGKGGRFDEAIEDFETAIALDPSYSRAHNNLGVAYAKTGLLNKAFEQFNKTILLNQDLAMAYYNRGLLYLRTDQTEAAAADFKKSCELGNDDGCGALRQLIGG
jgi:hypothetical protein